MAKLTVVAAVLVFEGNELRGKECKSVRDTDMALNSTGTQKKQTSGVTPQLSTHRQTDTEPLTQTQTHTEPHTPLPIEDQGQRTGS